MVEFIAYLRWRFFIGLAMMAISALALSMSERGTGWRSDRPTEAEAEHARQLEKEYQAEREIRQARRAEGYDPSDPSVVRDGYQAEEYSRDSYSNSEP